MFFSKITRSIFIAILFFLALFSQVEAQETLTARTYVPNEILVRYTDEAKQTIFSLPNASPPSSPLSAIDQIIALLGLRSTNPSTSTSPIATSYQELSQKLGITSQASLERTSPSPRTLKLEQAKITPIRAAGNDPLANVYLVGFSKGTVEEAVRAFQNSGLVSEAQPNYLYDLLKKPDDPNYPAMWDHQKILSEQAWDTSTGNDVIVAVVDSGTDHNHPDLANNMWTGAKDGQQIHGWNYGVCGSQSCVGDSNSMDIDGHGSHVSGTIGAVGNNGKGVVGINWKTKIMAVRVFRMSSGKLTASSAAISAGVRFAADNGAKVINMSLGSSGQSCRTNITRSGTMDIEDQVIANATDKGVLVVVAAGNDSANAACDWPANHPDVLTVTATGPNDERSSYSNYGMASWKNTKMVAAPGGNGSCSGSGCILSTWWPDPKYKSISGTSMASPHVAGLAALILSKENFTPAALRQRIIDTADDLPTGDKQLPQPNPSIPGDDGRRSFGKRINSFRALTGLTGTTPAPTATPTGPTPTIDPAAPTTTPPPPSPTPLVNENGDVSIWVEDTSGNIIADGSQVVRGTLVSVCYQRQAGLNRFTIYFDSQPVLQISRSFTSANTACLTSRGRRFMRVWNPASPLGTPHAYELESAGKTVRTTINVTTGSSGQPQPTTPLAPTNTPGAPEPTPTTREPAPTQAASASIQSLVDNVSNTQIRDYITNLEDDDSSTEVDSRQTRYSTLPGNEVEANYIANKLQSFGLVPFGSDYFQPFTIQGKTTRNIIGQVVGDDPNDSVVVLGHMDSTGQFSTPPSTTVAPGADDNGSGTAAVMETARILGGQKFGKTVIFLLTSGEEQGLLGSRHFLNILPGSKKITGAINLDMISYPPTKNCIRFFYNNHITGSKEIANKLFSNKSRYGINLEFREPQHSTVSLSDHDSFWNKGIPTVFGFECGGNPNYHKITDTIEGVSIPTITNTTKLVVATVAEMAGVK